MNARATRWLLRLALSATAAALVFWVVGPRDSNLLGAVPVEVAASVLAVAFALVTLCDAVLVPAYRAGRRQSVVAFVVGGFALGLAVSFWMSPFALPLAPVAIYIGNRVRDRELQTGLSRDRLSQMGYGFGCLALLVILGWLVYVVVWMALAI
jgi:hypothetical protein